MISFDLLGFGLTGAFLDDDYRIERYTHFVGAFLDHLGVKHAVLVGNSFGGYVAWETSLARPELADRLVLIDSRGYPVDPSLIPVGWRLAKIPIISSLMTRMPLRGLIGKSVLKVYGDPSRVTPKLIDRDYELTMRSGNRRALTLIFQQQAFTDWDGIKTVAIPTLILWGRRDPQIPISDAERFHREIACSHLVVFDKLGHVPEEEDPETSVKVVEAFLAH